MDQTASRYLDPESDGIATADDDSFQSNGWATIVVAVEGSTVATNVIQAENVLHIEAIPDKNGISTATPPASFSTAELEQVSKLRQGRTLRLRIWIGLRIFKKHCMLRLEV